MNNKLEELKATAAKLQKQIEELENPKQWEPRGGGYAVLSHGDVTLANTDTGRREYGTERIGKEAAEKASDAMRTHNRLLTYVDEFGGDWEADWHNPNQLKFTVLRSHELKQWSGTCFSGQETLGTVYMSKECQVGLIVKLNSGEVIL